MSSSIPPAGPRSGPAKALPLAALAVLLSLAQPAQAQRALLTHAERPAHLIRATAVHDAEAGVALQPGDIVDTAARTAQVEWPSGAAVALGPSSTMLIEEATAFPTVRLLRGWIKASAGGSPAGKLVVLAGPLSVIAAGSGVLRVGADKTELFVEQGTLIAGGETLGREQYGVYRAASGLVMEARPARLFVKEMPQAFFDPLVGLRERVKPALPVLLREAEVADIAQWTEAPSPAGRKLAARFAPRLADPAFREAAETTLAAQPEWRQVLRQHPRQRQRTDTTTNHLF